MFESMKHYDMIYVKHERYDMIDMQNDELAWNTTPAYTWKSQYTHESYDKWYDKRYEKW